MKVLGYGIAVLIASLFLASCQVMYSTFPPSTTLHFRVAHDLNPDQNERPSPVIVKVYELASKTVFENQDFFALYDDPSAVLRTDLLKKDEFVFEPGQSSESRMELHPATKAVGVIVAYRDIENARWRAVVDVKPTGYDDRYVFLESLAVYIREHDTTKRQR
ncbi:type VI secretion system lipoprotein TssJ [Alkalimonas collagenimarina]|uniref:Type VI secretion system lipoprotein TssJ n=1 Tax=Alkalimonas collagenimarina TaxID=400390 RepID=A0ABT9H2Y1_9GAMM|nr:type VI secretion system lipoprotein TssJ [Alkalimonas collagenimarina]MDP4537676.1 type VI secretion system lipoprotein TssJ [Alkalimonas collagenimarina]